MWRRGRGELAISSVSDMPLVRVQIASDGFANVDSRAYGEQ